MIIGLGEVVILDVLERRIVRPALGGVGPGFRVGHAAVHVRLCDTDAVLVYGGFSWHPGRPTVHSDLHLLDAEGFTWIGLSPSGLSPPGRFGHVLFPLTGSAVVGVFGGSDGFGSLNGLHLYDLEQNEWLADVITPQRNGPAETDFLVAGQIIPWHNTFLYFNNRELNSGIAGRNSSSFCDMCLAILTLGM